jgi:hypothetical protein
MAEAVVLDVAVAVAELSSLLHWVITIDTVIKERRAINFLNIVTP